MSSKSILQAATISVLAILLFSGIFLGVNNFVFARADAPVYVPIDTEISNVPFHVGEFSQIISPPQIRTHLYDAMPVSEFTQLAISQDDAALLGAQYIWEVFGETIDGSVVEMLLSDYLDGTVMHWLGAVVRNNEVAFTFIIDAFSGTGLSVSKLADMKPRFLTVEEFVNMDLYHPSDTAPYEQAATEAAYRFFRQTQIVSVTIEGVHLGDTRQVFQYGTNMVTGVYTQGRILTLTATDIFGRAVSVKVSCHYKEVFGVRRLL
jgi:hypothetical protein